MTTYPIPEYLSKFDHDDEWAIAAILRDRAVALLYLADIAPELSAYVGTPSLERVIRDWAQKAPTDFQQLQELGDVAAGIVTSEGFEERWQLGNWGPSDQLPDVL